MNATKSLFKNIKKFVFNNRLKNVGQINPIKITKYSPEMFREIYNREILILESAFVKLQEFDSIISHVGISNFNNTLMVEMENIGTYKIWMDPSECLLYFFSPNSGNFTYYYEDQEKRWNNIKDGHILEDLLCRELIKYTKGYLDI